MNFVAIDFETANSDRGSICAVGVAVVRGGEVTERIHRLIRPFDLRFDPYNTRLHGICADDVRHEPDIQELWPIIQRHLDNLPLVAHNASFDMSALRHAFDKHGMPYPTIDYTCTRLISQRVWPGLVSYSLSIVAKRLSIGFNHHDPVEDACACAEIALQACKHMGISNLQELMKRIGMCFGRLFPGGYDAPICRRMRRPGCDPMNEIQEDPEHPFFGKTVVFTGALQSMTRKEAWHYVTCIGGNCIDTMNNSVDYLVVGDLDFRTLQHGEGKSLKIKRAETMLARGKEIEVISEADFLRLL